MLCNERASNVIVHPCKHAVVCNKCAINLEGDQCPKCFQPVEYLRRMGINDTIILSRLTELKKKTIP